MDGERNLFILQFSYFPYVQYQFLKKLANYIYLWKFNTLYSFKFALRTNIKNLKNSIKSLKEKFIITYVDEIANNNAIICKYLYINKC